MKLTFSKVSGHRTLVCDGVWNIRFFLGNLSFDYHLENSRQHMDMGIDKGGKFHIYSKDSEGKTKHHIYERLEIE